ncbi:MAG TPA: DUF255 domain-containing protein [Thermoanaerobaculia bacterium]|nr:DUF255 domain-containing protein [Thermoanaerobaculia bacterium]
MVRSVIALLALLAPLVSARAESRYYADAAASPVKWEAWGPRALERAKKEKRPIFLSIGYASSYESFRMQREVFAHGEIATPLNAYFVPVLLDRFERPEIAESYETIARAMNVASDGPLHLVLMPSLEPFAAAGAMTPLELSRMLVRNANRWANERDALTAEARANVEKGRAVAEKRAPAALEPSLLDAVLDDVAKSYDTANARFRWNAPQPMTISFLLRYAERTKNEKIRALAADTLNKMALLPIRDQIGGGFHRAARDAAWHEPYFEKLLADQALLSIAYLEAFQLTRDPELERIARSTLDAVLRDLRQPAGGFDASQDAYSIVPAQGPEFWNGAFYMWEREPLTHLLEREGAEKIFRLYSIKDAPRNIPAVADPVRLKDPDVAPLLAKMLDVRQKRPQPFRENSVIAGLNALMISAFARAGAVLGERAYVDAATASARLITTKLWNAQQKTLRRSGGVEALAEDYALLVQGLLDLFEAAHDVRWLELAMAIQLRQDALFWDESMGRYMPGSSVPATLRGLLVERDAETPAVNSVAAMNLLRLAALTGNEAWRVRPGMIFQSFGTRLRTSGAELPQLASAYAASLAQSRIVVVTGDARRQATHDLLRSIHERWEPLRVVVFLPHKGPARDRVVQLLPFTGPLAADPEQAIEYECSGGECRRR